MAGRRPQDLVFTLFGDYLLARKEPVWVGSLIDLMEPFGLSEGSVRTVLSRMARKGWLTTRRRGRLSFYDLTSRGRELLEQGAERIFHPHWDAPWDGRWLLLAYSVPERQRHRRDRFRDRLAWLGFGSLGNGLWISPYDVACETRRAARELGLLDNLAYFRAEQMGKTDPSALVARCWDLPGLNSEYRSFIAEWSPVSRRCATAAGPDPLTPRECYVLRFRLIHEYRRFPERDPFLPRELLPDDWAGERAAGLFQSIHDVLAGPAEAYVHGILARGHAPAEAATH